MWHNLQFTADLVIYIKKLLNEKLHFLWSGWSEFKSNNFGKVLQLAQFLFTTSKTELNYYHQKLSVWAASRVAERLKTLDLRKLENLKKIFGMLGPDGEYLGWHPNAKFWWFCQNLAKNQRFHTKTSIHEKSISCKNLFSLISWICAQSFVQDCRSVPETLQQCGARVKTKSRRVLKAMSANCYTWWSWRGKTGTQSWIGSLHI